MKSQQSRIELVTTPGVIKRGATYTEALEISTLLPTPVTRARTTVFFIEHSFQKSDSSPKDSRDDDRIYQCLETLKADEILEVAERVLARCFSDIQVTFNYLSGL